MPSATRIALRSAQSGGAGGDHGAWGGSLPVSIGDHTCTLVVSDTVTCAGCAFPLVGDGDSAARFAFALFDIASACPPRTCSTRARTRASFLACAALFCSSRREPQSSAESSAAPVPSFVTPLTLTVASPSVATSIVSCQEAWGQHRAPCVGDGRQCYVLVMLRTQLHTAVLALTVVHTAHHTTHYYRKRSAAMRSVAMTSVLRRWR